MAKSYNTVDVVGINPLTTTILMSCAAAVCLFAHNTELRHSFVGVSLFLMWCLAWVYINFNVFSVFNYFNYLFFSQSWLNLHNSSVRGTPSQKSYPRSASIREGQGSITKDLIRKRIILLAVLRREIERLSIWRNPKMLPELRVPGEDLVRGWATQQPMTDKTWKDCIRVVWKESPHAAVHITLR